MTAATETTTAAPRARWQRDHKAQAKPRTLEQFTPLIHKMAAQASRRAQAAGILLEYDDIAQELRIHFLSVCKTYRDDGGRSFINYFIKGAWQKIAVLFRPYERQLKHGLTISGDAVRLSNRKTLSGWESVEDPTASPEEILEGNTMAHFIRSRLSPLAAQMFDVLVDPPEELYEQLSATDAGILLDRRGDLGEGSPRGQRYARIDLQFIGDLYGIDRYTARRARNEVNEAVAAYYQTHGPHVD